MLISGCSFSFGHGGEVALHYMMRKHGGFEGNGQTLRIVARLEPFSEGYGMNLARRTLLGLIKYPQLIENLIHKVPNCAPIHYRQLKASEWHPPKGLYADDQNILDWILSPLSNNDRDNFQAIGRRDNTHSKTLYKSLDCSIMELADDIAYGIHDLEDAIVTGVVNRNDFDEYVIKPLNHIGDKWLSEYSTTLTENLFSEQHHKQKDAIGGLVNYLITAIELLPVESNSYSFEEPLLKYNAKLPAEPASVLQIFKDFVFKFVIKLPAIQRLEYRGQQVVMELFEALSSDPERLLPTSTAKRWRQAADKGENHQRVIADYVSGMTDGYATKLYQTLFLPISHGDSYDANN
ncbi:dGTPase [Thalassotalea sp. M1531]|uniref:dGTPase n=1 Tax=Thalassotalea algicola TaxID=2716224 RepID=A0A7Y0LDR1_9GAMM|nr:anti-phage deoxyguanosine triphosphatase [Thalassotalea algicola]NMP32679.1 dGTPase [Thalassotalea algicola]